MIYKVMARTKRTDWVEVKVFENEAEARKLASEILNDARTEVCVETQEQRK